MKSSLIKSFLLALMLIFTGCSIEGTITNENGEYLENAKIVATYNETSQEVFSDIDGHYIVDDLDEGTEVTLIVSKGGYASQSSTVSVTRESEASNFTLIAQEAEIERIVGRIVDVDGNPMGNTYVRIDEDGWSRSTNDNDGSFSITNNDDIKEWIDFSKPVKLLFSIYDKEFKGSSTRTFERTYISSENIDANNPNTLNLGDIVVSYTTVKGCALNLDGSVFGHDIFDNGQKRINGVSLDSYIDNNTHPIYDEDNGEFEFKVAVGEETHTLTLYDEARNTKTISFTTGEEILDLRETCIQVEADSSKDIEVNVVGDITSNAIKVYHYENLLAEPTILEYSQSTQGSGSFSINQNGLYIIGLHTSEAENFDSLKNQSFNTKILGNEYTTTTDEEVHENRTPILVFEIYQGEILNYNTK